MVINLAVSSYESRKGKKLDSELLKADAAHTRSDFYSSLAVILSLVAAHYGYPQMDVVAALAITLIIAHAAFKILKENGMLLADTALLPAAQSACRWCSGVPGVESVHKIRTRAGTHGGACRSTYTVATRYEAGRGAFDRSPGGWRSCGGSLGCRMCWCMSSRRLGTRPGRHSKHRLGGSAETSEPIGRLQEAGRYLGGCRFGLDLVELDGDEVGDASLLHGDAVELGGGLHGELVVGDEHELGVGRHLLHQFDKA